MGILREEDGAGLRFNKNGRPSGHHRRCGEAPDLLPVQGLEKSGIGPQEWRQKKENNKTEP